MVHSRPEPWPEPLEDEYYAAAFVGFVPKDYPAGRSFLTRFFVNAVRRQSQGRHRTSGSNLKIAIYGCTPTSLSTKSPSLRLLRL